MGIQTTNMYSSAALILIVGISAVSGQFLNCNWVSSLNCGKYGNQVECGTGYKDYQNRCFFAKAQCKNSDLHIYADGSCASAGYTPAAGSVTTAKPAATGPTTTRSPLFLGHNAVLDFFCLELQHEPCVDNTEQVCGTDGDTYASFCEFEKQRCTHRDLQVKHFGAC